VDLHLFTRRNFVVGTICIGVAYFAFTGVNIIFPLWLQTTLGYTSTMAGFAMAPVGIVALFIAPVLGGNIARINLRLAPTIAFVILSGSLLWFSQQNEQASFSQLATPRFVMGFGLSLFFLPLNQIIMAGVSHAELASTAGLSNFVRTISGSISTAACVFMWNDRSEQHYARLTETLTPDSVAWMDYQAQLAQQGITGDAALLQMSHLAQTQATTLGTNDLFYMLALLFVALIPAVWMARPPFRSIGMGGPH
jgi:DHA2 family multidrug resistance protein